MTEPTYSWNQEKDAFLRETRGIGFGQIIEAIRGGRLLADVPSPRAKFPGQRIYVVDIDGYAIVVPYVREGDQVFLKTLFPDRKAKKRILGN